MHQQLENALLMSYEQFYKNNGAPSWAVLDKVNNEPIRPSIPFIGKNYHSSQLKLAIFASAENLTYYEESDGYDLLETDFAWNRHRVAFERWLKSDKSSFFPKVHIAPVENGGLLCLALFLYFMCGIEWKGTPSDLLEEIVVANVGKYSMRTNKTKRRRNIDYAGNSSALDYSTPYFRMDIGALKPKLLVMPHQMYNQSKIRESIAELIPDSRVVAVYQFNPTNINAHLKKYEQEAKALESKIHQHFPLLSEWSKEIRGIRTVNVYRYYFHVQSLFGRE